MGVGRDTLRIHGGIRIRIADEVDGITDDLVRAWANGWQLVLSDWESAVTDLQHIRDDGRWPTRSQIIHAERVQKALEATFAGLNRLSDLAGVSISYGINNATQAALGHIDVIGSQLPGGVRGEIASHLIRADPEQIRAIVVRTQEQVTKTLSPVAGDAFTTLRSTLVRGVANGQNPRIVARQMVRGLELGFNTALTRAMVIARSEILDAHRAGALAVRQANTDVLAGWEWIAQLDSRTCPSCWAQHGTMHPVDEFGPIDHQQGRCAAMARTKTWKELGFDIPEPPSIVPDGETTFFGLPQADQVKVMGQKRLDLLTSGQVQWSELSTLQHNPGWRDSQVVTPLRSLSSSS